MTQDPVRFAVIGGSGLYNIQGLGNVEECRVDTPFGGPSDAMVIGTLSGVRVAFLARHGRYHTISPSEINYRANLYALKTLGVERVLAVSACGSLREHLQPGDVVVPDQLFDFTRGRERSFFGEGLVAHVGVADPFCSELGAQLAAASETAGGRVHRGGHFITVEGPRFSTRGESQTYRAWGMDLIGMTTSPEAFLAREAELCYAVMAHITDYDVWHASEDDVSVELVTQRLAQNTALAARVLADLLPALDAAPRSCACGHALSSAIITAREHVPQARLDALAAIVGRYFAKV